ncbi:divergent protein kinase domain 1C-like isoform X2 [Xenia sp. Carnegie-2017]|uniref:divergent protein kinase domain 1C-like isoform X2 n=1 Tax=Xenia sp. Carnegie-2017 TaxID=2897299 RepID=UPI001F03A09A|nr:divergent protein kinase domain 1C-like isoform X2 [Xenia sp. Carnegie-2017]
MWKRRKRTILIALTFLVLAFLLIRSRNGHSQSIYDSFNGITCDEKKGRALLYALCHSYHTGIVAGNLCYDLCTSRNLFIKQCLSHNDKNTIFAAVLNKQDIILKTKKAAAYSSWEDIFPASNVVDAFVLRQSFSAAVYDHVVTQLLHIDDVISDRHKLSNLSPDDFLKYLMHMPSVSSYTEAEMRSLWQLLHQDEYYLLQVLKDLKHFPKIFGTCGRFYAVEKVETLTSLVGIRVISASISWKIQVKVALEIMDFVRELNLQGAYGFNWHHCDIHGENFGINAMGELKAIDVDMLYTSEKLSEIFEEQSENCTSHKVCKFFDCASQCNLETNRCNSQVISNNLQVVLP